MSDTIFLLDDEESFLNSARLILRSAGFNKVITCADSRRALETIAQERPAIALLDLTMPYVGGYDVLQQLTAQYPETVAVIVTGINEVKTAVDCIKAGAYDYLVKPVNHDGLIACVKRAMEHHRMQRQMETLKNYILTGDLENPSSFSGIITQDQSMQNVFRYAEAIAATALPVLIMGETGTGKELLARAIHKASNLKGEFVPLNIAGVDDNMFSDTLFGHKKGSFTGAGEAREGLIGRARQGTIFFDEIGDLTAETQTKLLRLLQEGTFYQVGSDIERRSQARIITATHRNLSAMQEQGAFRRDLFYRLQSHSLTIPPLRERSGDIVYLVEYFLEQAAASFKKKKPAFPPELLTLLAGYHFPGNVRELQGLIFDSVSVHQSGVLITKLIQEKLYGSGRASSVPLEGAPIPAVIGYPARLPCLKEAEDALIIEALRRCNDNKTMAARMLGLTRQTLNNRLKGR